MTSSCLIPLIPPIITLYWLQALTEGLAGYYAQAVDAPVDPVRILITTWASGALNHVCLSVINPGDEILMPDPSYPAIQNFVLAAGGVARLIPTRADERFQL